MWRHGIPSRQYDTVPGDALQCGEGGLQLVPRGPRTSLTFRTRMVGVYIFWSILPLELIYI